jgi:hypothetical protein
VHGTPSKSGRGDQIGEERDVPYAKVDSQNPHLPLAMRAASSPVKITGEVSELERAEDFVGDSFPGSAFFVAGGIL